MHLTTQNPPPQSSVPPPPPPLLLYLTSPHLTTHRTITTSFPLHLPLPKPPLLTCSLPRTNATYAHHPPSAASLRPNPTPSHITSGDTGRHNIRAFLHPSINPAHKSQSDNRPFTTPISTPPSSFHAPPLEHLHNSIIHMPVPKPPPIIRRHSPRPSHNGRRIRRP